MQLLITPDHNSYRLSCIHIVGTLYSHPTPLAVTLALFYVPTYLILNVHCDTTEFYILILTFQRSTYRKLPKMALASRYAPGRLAPPQKPPRSYSLSINKKKAKLITPIREGGGAILKRISKIPLLAVFSSQPFVGLNGIISTTPNSIMQQCLIVRR